MNELFCSKDDFIEYINQYIFGNLKSITFDLITITKIRDALRIPIKVCEENNIAIYDIFPLTIATVDNKEVKIYQNGNTYLHDGDSITCLFREYWSDSICQE